jgi:vacuolar-type H+-ATPase catalytic subunit A/Vma1
METTETMQAPVHYNPNQLVTYKVINGDEVTYPTDKVVDLEWTLDQARRTEKRFDSLQRSVYALESALGDWIENQTDAEEIVSQICDMFGFNPTKEVEFEATATITGMVTVPLKDLASFDINDVDLMVNVESYSYDVNADIEVDHITTL